MQITLKLAVFHTIVEETVLTVVHYPDLELGTGNSN